MILDQILNLNVFQFGVGGTGSWLVPFVSKFLNNIRLRYENINCRYNLIDDDVVEQRNILRQNFDEEDINRIKAHCLVRSQVYRFQNITAFSKRINSTSQIDNIFEDCMTVPTYYINSLNIIFGCVDNNKTRRIINKYINDSFEYPTVYFDSGNNLHNGQIVTVWNNIENYDICGTDQKQISFNKVFSDKNENTKQQSCDFFGDQSQSINIFAATHLFINFQTLIINNQIPPNFKTFNSSGFSSFEI